VDVDGGVLVYRTVPSAPSGQAPGSRAPRRRLRAILDALPARAYPEPANHPLEANAVNGGTEYFPTSQPWTMHYEALGACAVHVLTS